MAKKKPLEKRQITFQMAGDVHAWLSEKAQRESTSVATVLRQIIRSDMEASQASR